MSAQISYFRLGLFVLVGLGLIVSGVIMLGAGALMKKTIPVETYMNESVQGLDVGAPVKYMGVQIGKVSNIGFVPEEYDMATTEQRVQFGKYILIRMELEPEKIPGGVQQGRGDLLQERVAAGLRIRLQSSLTAPAFLEADYFDPKVHKPLEIAWKPRVAYVPAAPGTMKQVVSTVERLAAEIEKAQIAKTVNNINTLAVDMDKALNQIQIPRVSEQVVGFMAEIRQTNGRIKSLLDKPELGKTIDDLSEITASIRGTVTGSQKDFRAFLADMPAIGENLKSSSKQIDEILSGPELKRILTGMAQASDNAGPATADIAKAVRRIDNLVVSQQRNIELLLTSLRKVSQNMETISEDAKQNPSRVIMGDPPPRLKPGEKR